MDIDTHLKRVASLSLCLSSLICHVVSSIIMRESLTKVGFVYDVYDVYDV